MSTVDARARPRDDVPAGHARPRRRAPGGPGAVRPRAGAAGPGRGRASARRWRSGSACSPAGACGALWRTRVHTESAVITGPDPRAAVLAGARRPSGSASSPLAAAARARCPSSWSRSAPGTCSTPPPRARSSRACWRRPSGASGPPGGWRHPRCCPSSPSPRWPSSCAPVGSRSWRTYLGRRARRAPAAARRRRSRAARRPAAPRCSPTRSSSPPGFMLTEPLTLPPRRWQQLSEAALVGRADGRTVQPRRRCTPHPSSRSWSATSWPSPWVSGGRPPAGARPAHGHARHPRGRVRVRRRRAVPARAVDRAARPAHGHRRARVAPGVLARHPARPRGRGRRRVPA